MGVLLASISAARFGDTPNDPGLVSMMNAVLAPLLGNDINGVAFDAQENSRYSGYELTLTVSYATGGTTVTNPFKIVGFTGASLAETTANAQAFIDANPSYFVSPLFTRLIRTARSTTAVVGVVFYNESSSDGSANWKVNGAGSGGGGTPTGPAGGDLGGTYPNPSVETVGGATAANVASGAAAANAATNANTVGAIVKRDGSGNFSAGTITAALAGNATSATTADHATTADSATTADHATTADSATTAGTATDFSGSLAGDVAGSQTATVIQPHVVSNAKLAQAPSMSVKANITNATADEQDVPFADLGAALTPYLPESLAMMNETPLPTSNVNRIGILVDVPGQGQVSLNTVTTTQTGALGWFDWSTYLWHEVTISGVAGITYATAIYVPTTNKIWAANNTGVLHIIDPVTGVATLSALVLFQFVYNAKDSKVYGYTNASTSIRQIDPATQTVLLTFADAAATAGFSMIGVDGTSGMLYLWRNNTGSPIGNFVVAIDTTTFTSIAWSTNAGTSNPGNQNDRITVCHAKNKALVAGSAFNFGVIVDTNLHTTFVWKGRFLNGCFPTVNPTTGFIYIAYLSQCFWAGKIDPGTAFFDTIANTLLASTSSGAQVKSACWASDGHFVVQLNSATYIRLYP